MKVFVTTIGNEPWSREQLSYFHSLTTCDRFQIHTLAADAASADAILFVDLHQFPTDWSLKALHRHPLSQEYENKVLVYDERDRPHDVFPGIFVSMGKSYFDSARQRACAFCHLKNELMDSDSHEPDLLFSFQGAKSHKARFPIFQLEHPRAIIEDTTQVNFFDFSEYSETQEYKDRVSAQKKRYQEVVARSKFVLCPRGMGTSSFRLFETLAAGRVPVIISDEWVAPNGPDWEACSIRIQESEVDTLPQLLEDREQAWPQMAVTAKQVFHDWFARDVMFHRLMNECESLLKEGKLGRQHGVTLDRNLFQNGWNYYQGYGRSQAGLLKRRITSKLGR